MRPAHLGVTRTTDEKFIGAHEHILVGYAWLVKACSVEIAQAHHGC